MHKRLVFIIATTITGCGPVDGDCFDRCYTNCGAVKAGLTLAPSPYQQHVSCYGILAWRV
jgi:hypothetical protein